MEKIKEYFSQKINEVKILVEKKFESVV